MRERPILFRPEMVRALLSGAKTQTRRLVKSIELRDGIKGVRVPGGAACYLDFEIPGLGWKPFGGSPTIPYPPDKVAAACPYGAPGDRLWVREAFARDYFSAAPYEEPTKRHGYRADWTSRAADVVPEPRWTPSIHMPRWASRIDLEVTGVRVERLQDISEADAVAEGADSMTASRAMWRGSASLDGCARAGYPDAPRNTGDWTPRDCFRLLWGAINGPESWSANPWTWVVEFRRVRP